MQKSPHVGVMLDLSSSYGREVFRGISTYVRMRGPWTMFVSGRAVNPLPEDLTDWDGDGLIGEITTPELATTVASLGAAVVNVSNLEPGLEFPSVVTDDEQVGWLVAEYLHELGLPRFAYCGEGGRKYSQDRADGFVKRLHDFGKDCEVFESEFEMDDAEQWDAGIAQLRNWVEALDKPVGIMAATDMKGSQLLDVCRAALIDVPDDISVVAVDNDDLICELTRPPMTSMALDPVRIGFEAASTLDRLMRKRDETPNVEVKLVGPEQVVERESSQFLMI